MDIRMSRLTRLTANKSNAYIRFAWTEIKFNIYQVQYALTIFYTKLSPTRHINLTKTESCHDIRAFHH